MKLHSLLKLLVAMTHLLSTRWIAVALIFWAAGIGFGLKELWSYQFQAAAAIQPPARIEPVVETSEPGRPTLWLFLHPRCPCSRATLHELKQLLVELPGATEVRIVFCRPEGAPEDWCQTSLYASAEQIPGALVLQDEGQRLQRRFGVMNSGQVLLYAADGQLLFQGGVTASRGHQGDNEGRRQLQRVISSGEQPQHVGCHPVYGCPLDHLHSSLPSESGT